MAASRGEMQGRLPSLAKYEIIEEIGHGGMATVYRARDPRLARDVAIKVIHPHLRDSTEIAHRFHHGRRTAGINIAWLMRRLVFGEDVDGEGRRVPEGLEVLAALAQAP